VAENGLEEEQLMVCDEGENKFESLINNTATIDAG
jgi:hypothetical protein